MNNFLFQCLVNEKKYWEIWNICDQKGIQVPCKHWGAYSCPILEKTYGGLALNANSQIRPNFGKVVSFNRFKNIIEGKMYTVKVENKTVRESILEMLSGYDLVDWGLVIKDKDEPYLLYDSSSLNDNPVFTDDYDNGYDRVSLNEFLEYCFNFNKKIMIGDDEVVIHDDGSITVGCTEVTREQIVKIKELSDEKVG